MTNGIIEIENGFAVKDFETGRISFELGTLSFPSYDDAVESCFGRYYPRSYRRYLRQAGTLDTTPDADTWENMIYANDPNGIWDGEQKISQRYIHGPWGGNSKRDCLCGCIGCDIYKSCKNGSTQPGSMRTRFIFCRRCF